MKALVAVQRARPVVEPIGGLGELLALANSLITTNITLEKHSD